MSGDGIEGIHGIGEADEPPLCPCGKGYVGHLQPNLDCRSLEELRQAYRFAAAEDGPEPEAP